MPNIYIIGGYNGSGKTTVSLRLLPDLLECFEYVNADARPECPPSIQSQLHILAGRLMIQRLRSRSYSGTDSASLDNFSRS